MVSVLLPQMLQTLFYLLSINQEFWLLSESSCQSSRLTKSMKHDLECSSTKLGKWLNLLFFFFFFFLIQLLYFLVFNDKTLHFCIFRFSIALIGFVISFDTPLLDPSPTEGPLKSLLSVCPSVRLPVCPSISLDFFSEMAQ